MSASLSGMHSGSSRYQRALDPNLLDFLGPDAIPPPIKQTAFLTHPAQKKDVAWHRTPLYSKTEYGPSRRSSPTFFSRHHKLPRDAPHAYKPQKMPFGSNLIYEKSNSKLGGDSSTEGIVRRSPTKHLDDNTLNDGRVFCALQPDLMQRMGYSVAHLHKQPTEKDEGLIPRRPKNGRYKVVMEVQGRKTEVETSSPIPQAHYANPNAAGDPGSVFNPSVLAGCTWPVGRREVLRNSATFCKADPFELFPNEYAQVGNAGQIASQVPYEKGPALSSSLTGNNTAADYASQFEAPAWQVAKGVMHNRFRTISTPYRSVRRRATEEELAEERKQEQKKETRTIKAELEWIAAGEKRFRLDAHQTTGMPKELREADAMRDLLAGKSIPK